MSLAAPLDVADAKCELVDLAGELRALEAERERLYDRRAALFAALLEAGERQGELARLVGMKSPMTVVFAVKKRAPGRDLGA